MPAIEPGVDAAPRARPSVVRNPERSTALWDRLSILEQGFTALVMDRGNGKWALIPGSTVPMVRLLLVDEAALPDAWLLPIARHFRDLGCAGWGWSLFQPVGRGRDYARHLDFSVDRLIVSWNELFDAVDSGEFDGFAVRPILEYVDNFFDGPRGSMCKRKDCGAGRDLLSISADGAVEACDCIDRTGPLAGLGRLDSTKPDSLRESRRTEKAEMIRSRDVERGKCASCMWLSVCGGTCLAYAPSLHGVWEAECAVAMNAFERIAASVAASDRLRKYRRSCQHRVS